MSLYDHQEAKLAQIARRDRTPESDRITELSVRLEGAERAVGLLLNAVGRLDERMEELRKKFTGLCLCSAAPAVPVVRRRPATGGRLRKRHRGTS